MKSVAVRLAGCFAIGCAALAPAWGFDDRDAPIVTPGANFEKWKESAHPLPPYPQEEDLLRVPLPTRDTLSVFLDVSSLSVGQDQVSRYTAVVQSAAGARNVLHEGVRCSTREYKTYAYGKADRTFEAVKDSNWRPIPTFESGQFRFHLYQSYLCGDFGARVPREVVRVIRNSMRGYE